MVLVLQHCSVLDYPAHVSLSRLSLLLLYSGMVLLDEVICYVSVDGLAWDWVNQKIYWTDACYDRIEVYDPALGIRKTLIETGSLPRAIVVDPGTGYAAYLNPSGRDHMYNVYLTISPFWLLFLHGSVAILISS